MPNENMIHYGATNHNDEGVTEDALFGIPIELVRQGLAMEDAGRLEWLAQGAPETTEVGMADNWERPEVSAEDVHPYAVDLAASLRIAEERMPYYQLNTDDEELIASIEADMQVAIGDAILEAVRTVARESPFKYGALRGRQMIGGQTQQRPRLGW